MPISEEQRLARRSSIGSSDMAAIMGYSPYRNAYDVWLEKTGQLEDSDNPSEAMELGTEMESVVLHFAAKELGELDDNVHVEYPEFHLAANVDAVLRDTGIPLEAKTSGINGRVYGNWGTPGTDEVPEHVIIQAHVHMVCLEHVTKKQVPFCWVPTIIGGRGFNLYKVPHVSKITNAIKKAALEFWACVESGIAPINATPSLVTVERMHREPKSFCDLPADVIGRWIAASDAVKVAEKALDEAKTALLLSLGKHEGGTSDENGIQVTYLEQNRTGFDVKRFTKDHPDLAEKYKTSSPFRVLRKKTLPMEE